MRNLNNAPTIVLIILFSCSPTVLTAQKDRKPTQRTTDPFDIFEDPFDAAENPFDDPPKNETVQQKHLRILKSQRAAVELRDREIIQLKKEIEASSRTEQRLVKLALDSVTILLDSKETAEQIKGIQLLESVIQAIGETGETPLAEVNVSKPSQTFQSVLPKFLDSDDLELRSAVIGLLERNLYDSGIRLGYQPANGYWHPVNDASGKSAMIRRRINQQGNLLFFKEPLTEVLSLITDYTTVEFDHRHTVALDEITFDYTVETSSYLEVLDAALRKAKLNYAIGEGKIIIAPEGSSDLKVTQVFNVRGLLTSELKVADIVKLIETGLSDSKLKNLTTIDVSRIMATGSEQQLIKVAKVLGLLVSTGQPNKTPMRN